MPDPARIAQAQVLEIPVTIQGEKAVDETGQREPFAESTKTALTFDNGAVLKLQARVKAGESVSLRNEQSGKEIQCKVLEAPPEGQMGYTDLEFVESVSDFWEGHAEQAAAAAEKSGAGVTKSDAESAAEKPQPAVAAPEAEPAMETKPAAEAESIAAQESAPEQRPEPEVAAKVEPPAERLEPAKTDTVAAEPQTFTATPEATVAQPDMHAREETEAAAENSLAMMSATAAEVKLPPVTAPAPEEKPEAPRPQIQKPQGRLREELVPAHEMVPETAPAPSAAPTLSAVVTLPAPSATGPTGEQIDAALRKMQSVLAHPQDAAEPNDAKDQANLAALMAREARLAKYALLKDKAASQIGRGATPQGASKSAEATAGEAGANVEGEVEVKAGPPKPPLSERLTTGKNAVI